MKSVGCDQSCFNVVFHAHLFTPITVDSAFNEILQVMCISYHSATASHCIRRMRRTFGAEE